MLPLPGCHYIATARVQHRAPRRAQGQAEIVRMQKTVTGLGSQMRVLVASVRRPADMAALAAQARLNKKVDTAACINAMSLCGKSHASVPQRTEQSLDFWLLPDMVKAT